MKNIPDQIVQYQIDLLQAEIDHLELNPRFLAQHLQNFSWTVSRATGFGHRRDGWRGKPVFPPRPFLNTSGLPAQRVPRILIDVTQTFLHGMSSGIPRVVLEIAKAAAESGSGLPIFFHHRDIVPYYRHAMLPDKVEIIEGDILLLLDLVWYAADAYLPIMQEVLRNGGTIVLGLHDLIPLLYPAVSDRFSTDAYRRWLERAIPLADAIVTVSKSTALDLCDYVAQTGLKHKSDLSVGWCHLGADFDSDSLASPSQNVVDLCRHTPFFLTVGTLEPRKCHAIALAAFEKLWNSGTDVGYVIVGKCGWNVRSLRKRILDHREYGRRLFWLDRASDADLRHAYRHATGLVFPSFDEGFGLPLVEAAHYGVPAIASDIPIFREIGGDAIAYFTVLDSDALADRIRDALAGKSVAPSFPVHTWREATEGLLELIRTRSYQFSLDGPLAGTSKHAQTQS